MILDEAIKKKYKTWIESEYFDEASRRELLSINDPEEIEDRFYTDLKFGTGGVRGVIGAGSNRMNRYVLRLIIQGLAETILEYGKEARERGVVIAYDSRHYSREFALETALVLAANGIRGFLFKGLRPTPVLSFAVRYLQAIAGVNITASHNSKEYNGFKIYWEDGGQLPPEPASQIIAKTVNRGSWEVSLKDETSARADGFLHWVDDSVDQAYEDEIIKSLIYPKLFRELRSSLKIVFTPLHGTGGAPVQTILEKLGFNSIAVVPEQEKPDPDFSTVKYPNPEDPAAFKLAMDMAEKNVSHLILATDPDADRLGVYARDPAGRYHRFTGNQIGIILEYYILSQRKKLNTLPDDAVVIKSVATTDLANVIASHYGVKTVNVLVGFKHIGEQIKKMEQIGCGTFVFGFEESHGYLAGTYTRDKDAVQAAALIAEAAFYYLHKEQKTLPEVLQDIFRKFGTYIDKQVAFTLEGKKGRNGIKAVMDRLRKEKPQSIGGVSVRCIEDYQIDKRWYVHENREEEIGLPKENILRFSFVHGGYFMVRPSGTEPKIRYYFCIKGGSIAEANKLMQKVEEDVSEYVSEFM